MAKVYIFLANGFEEIEGLTVVDLLRRAEIETTMVSIMGTKEIIGAHNIKLEADALFEDIDYSDADMLILPGGMPGTTNLAEHQELVNLLVEFNQKRRKLAAICAAPSVLGMNGILKDKKATCYPGYEDKLIGAITTGNNVEKSDNVITGKGMGVSIEFSLCIIAELKGTKTADQIAQAIQYK